MSNLCCITKKYNMNNNLYLKGETCHSRNNEFRIVGPHPDRCGYVNAPPVREDIWN